ncbi:glycosyltransferase family 2 protein [Microvirga puerhi]|uniref:Glycosyltransferase n=1 Tax=Microvirga puerhi TaxID=2876078 RepID=A0ABS7VLP7_9HYPH|nr:glycosyltransferase [Microvirga puerhi]MBZ6075878.1 glycosyltransferase [Microvirga puerhi]
MKGDQLDTTAVIIPHYRDEERLDKCLGALAANDGFDSVEVIVVDNDSGIDLSPLSSKYPSVQFVIETTRGAAATRNRGVRESSSSMLFFIDSDCVPAPNWLRAGRAALQKSDIVGGSVDLFDETPPPRNGAQIFETVFAFNQRQYIEKQGFSVTANLLTWRHVFADVGGFRSRVSEDVDWCHRALKKGYRLVFDDGVVVAHPTRRDLSDLTRKWKRMVQERFELQTQRRFARTYWATRACLVLCSPLLDVRRILLSQHVHGLKEILRGAYVLFYLRTLRFIWMMRQVISGHLDRRDADYHPSRAQLKS